MLDESFLVVAQSRKGGSDSPIEIESLGMLEPTVVPVRRAISFGPFHLPQQQRLLLNAGRSIHLGGRALDILLVLVERPGEVVGKRELIARVWPDTFVEESNLKTQVAALRRALGDGRDGKRYLVTVHGRGYCFAAPVTLTE